MIRAQAPVVLGDIGEIFKEAVKSGSAHAEDPRGLGLVPGTSDQGYVDVFGYTCENESPETCPVCGAKGKAFFKVE